MKQIFSCLLGKSSCEYLNSKKHSVENLMEYIKKQKIKIKTLEKEISTKDSKIKEQESTISSSSSSSSSASSSSSSLSTTVINKETKLNSLSQLLESSSFNRVLDRGFALIMDIDGKPIKLSSEAPKNANVKIKFADEIRSAQLD